jgi:hypothetical protein
MAMTTTMPPAVDDCASRDYRPASPGSRCLGSLVMTPSVASTRLRQAFWHGFAPKRTAQHRTLAWKGGHATRLTGAHHRLGR